MKKIVPTYLATFFLVISFSLAKNTNFKLEKDILYECSGDEYSSLEHTPSLANDFILPDFPILPPDNPFPPMVPAIENHYYTNPDFTVDYFSNLTNNFVNNVAGNCGLTAISMLLGYYDTYWNDDIIPSQYDALGFLTNGILNGSGSPGVYDESYFSFSNENADENVKNQELNNFISIKIENMDYDFFGLLLYHAGIVGAYNGVKDSLGLGYETMVGILNSYLVTNSVLSNNSTLMHGKLSDFSSPSQMRNHIISLVEQGQPVIIGGNGYNDKNNNSVYDDKIDIKFGHICIAYAYDSVNDKLIGNGGWGNGTIDFNGQILSRVSLDLDTYFNYQLSDFYYIDLLDSVAHNHPYNYFSYNNNSYLCSCELENHIHNFEYTTFDDTDHYRKCICMSLSEKHNHFFTSSFFDGGNEYCVCGGCGYSVLATLVPQPGV